MSRCDFGRNHVDTARRRGKRTVTVHVGDVVGEFDTPPRIPAVCGVPGSSLFEREARVRRLAVDGPVPGSNTLFVFKLKG